jgi:hypothetical protein
MTITKTTNSAWAKSPESQDAKASSLDMSDLGARMAARKDELLAQAA